MVNGTCGYSGSTCEFLLGNVVFFAVVDERFRHLDRRQKRREVFVRQAQLFSFFI